MGIDCEFRASNIIDIDSVRALPDVYGMYRPGEYSFCPKDRWVITTLIRWVEYGPGRGPKVATLARALRVHCIGLEIGGDNGTPFVLVTDALILALDTESFDWNDHL